MQEQGVITWRLSLIPIRLVHRWDWRSQNIVEHGLGPRVEKNPFAESSTGSCLVAFSWDVQDFHQPPAHFPVRGSVNAQFSLPT